VEDLRRRHGTVTTRFAEAARAHARSSSATPRVERLLVETASRAGVALADGREIKASVVVSTPTRSAMKQLAEFPRL